MYEEIETLRFVESRWISDETPLARSRVDEPWKINAICERA